MAECGQEMCEQWDGVGCPCRVLDMEPKIADCASCGESEADPNECPRSKRACGHHCNHVWTHDECDWCGAVFGEDPDVSARPGSQP